MGSQVGDAAGLFEALGEVGGGKGIVNGLRGDGRAIMVEDLWCNPVVLSRQDKLPDGAVNIELKIIDIQPGDELSGALRPGEEQPDDAKLVPDGTTRSRRSCPHLAGLVPDEGSGRRAAEGPAWNGTEKVDTINVLKIQIQMG